MHNASCLSYTKHHHFFVANPTFRSSVVDVCIDHGFRSSINVYKLVILEVCEVVQG